MVHRALVVGGDVGVEERHLHGARAQAARVEAQQQVQLVLDGLHLRAGRGWKRGLAGTGGGTWGRDAAGRRGFPGEGDIWETRLLREGGCDRKGGAWPEGGTKLGTWGLFPAPPPTNEI